MAGTSPALSNHEAFLLILNDPQGRGALFEFLKTGYSEHHLTFWEEVELKYKPIEDTKERNECAKEFYERFIKNGSKQQINITEPQRLRLQAAIEKIGTKDSEGKIDSAAPDLFAEAASACLELIKGNYFFTFQQSKQYERYKLEKKQREEAEAKEKEKKSTTCTIL